MAFEHTEEFAKMSVNHLEGRTSAFFCYRDKGGDELDGTGRPKILQYKTISILQKNPLITKGMLMLRWYGSTVTEVLKFQTIYGHIR